MKIAAFSSHGPTLCKVRGAMLGAMVQAGHTVIASAPDCTEEMVADLARLGVHYKKLPLVRRGLNPLWDISYLASVYRFLRRENPDVCFFTTIKPVIYGSFAARAAGIERTYSLITGLGYTFIAGTTAARGLSLITNILYSRALRLNRLVFFQNPDDRDLFTERRLVDPTKSRVVNGSGIDLQEYPQLRIPPGPPAFLMIARLLRSKGVHEFLLAAERIKSRHPECEFRLVGSPEKGPDSIPQSDIEDRARRGIIEYVGEVRDVRPEIARCTVYVLPSYREGIPRSVLEAMSSGRPVITTDVPGCRQTVQPGVNGLLVPPFDSEALAKAMEHLLRNPTLIEPMGRASRKIAAEKFDVREINSELLGEMQLASSSIEPRENQ
jgi:glycosyltransferase involved in cell wall biosynthesis